jgi:hypothetical protein
MSKKNLFNKKFNKSLLSITKRIESFFNFFKENFSYKKKFPRNLNAIDKRIFITIAVIFITVIGYFLSPSFYDKNKIKAELENQILDQYNLKVKIDASLKYGLFPKPHFYSKDTIINYKSNVVAKSNNTKIFISINNFFSLKNIKIKNLVFKKTDFKFNNLSYNFFINLLINNKSNHEINFIDSKLFYLDQNGDMIFYANLKRLNFLNKDNFLQRFNSKLDIFNIPVDLEVENNTFEKNFVTKINSHPLRLNIRGKTNYDDKELDGKLDFTIINKNNKISYSLKNNSLKFNTDENEFTGDINIKPFFLNSNLKFYQIDLKKIFKGDSILVNLFKSEILNNKNLNGEINISTNTLKDINFLSKIKFNIILDEGELILKNLETIFKDSVIINLSDTQLIIDNNKLKFAGYVSLDFIDINNFYAHYQINRNYRKNIKKIYFGFFLNLDDSFIEIDNLKVNGNTNKNLEKFLDEFNSRRDDIFNKIIVRNSIKNFLKNF